MGIGGTVKSMFKDEHAPSEAAENSGNRISRTSGTNDEEVLNDPSKITNSTRASHKLPTGTGPGTSGKPVHETIMEEDAARARTSQGSAGYGTDAAAALGGSLSGTHSAANRASFSEDQTRSRTVPGTRQETSAIGTSTSRDFSRSSFGHTAVLDDHHTSGHSKRDVMPSGDTTEDTTQLNPVTHEFIRHIEREEVQRVKDHERHVHHVQHHTQPVVTRQELPEKHQNTVQATTNIQERHANKPEDTTLFDGQVHQQHDTIKHGAKERTVLDKGTTVTEHVHHHVHHVIQPVIERETIDREAIHTTVPIHEVTQEAPVVHQSQAHAPIELERFVERGGAMSGISQDEISSRVLNQGQCTREVDGVAEDVQHLHVSKEPEFIETKVTQKTTTVIDPDAYVVPPARN